MILPVLATLSPPWRHTRFMSLSNGIIQISLLLTLASSSLSDPLPKSRRITWDAGIPGGIPDVSVKANVMSFGAAVDGKTDDWPAFQAAIDAVDSGAVLIPEGVYRLASGLKIGKSVVLRGEGIDRTRLLFDITDRVAIEIFTYDRGEWTTVTSGYEFASTTIRVNDGSLFNTGDFAEILQDNDPKLMYTDDRWDENWAKDSVGQILTIASVKGNELTLDRPLYLTYRSDLNPRIRTQGFVTNAGVEHLSIKLTAKGDPTTISFKNAAYCWVQNVRSTFTSRVHVSLTTAYRCVVRDSYFGDSYEFGGGGHGYGVNSAHHTSDCLIENNVFKHLRHSMLVQVGATGNVFGYNYSIEPESDGTWTPCDISLHGHYPYANLFEGNIVQEIDISDYWGPVGPRNTFLRNRVESEGIDILDHSHGQNLIGNVLGIGKNRITVHKSVNETFLYGNHPDHSDDVTTIPASYYLSQKPPFFGSEAWPVNNTATIEKIPSQIRYEARLFGPE